jgi:hypothetical protein
MENQKFYLEAEISTWSGKNEQTDDILMLGVRV